MSLGNVSAIGQELEMKEKRLQQQGLFLSLPSA